MTAVEVHLCRCGHPARLHDDEVTGVLGECTRATCGCFAYRHVVGADSPAPVIALPVAAVPDLPPAIEPPQDVDVPPALSYPCPECGEEFLRPQGLGAHKRYKHPTGPKLAAAKEQPAPPVAPVEESPPVPDAEIVEDVDSGSRPVGADELLLGLVEAIESVVTGDACGLLQQAFTIRDRFAEWGWTVIEATS